jgi:hypothetical protein
MPLFPNLPAEDAEDGLAFFLFSFLVGLFVTSPLVILYAIICFAHVKRNTDGNQKHDDPR